MTGDETESTEPAESSDAKTVELWMDYVTAAGTFSEMESSMSIMAAQLENYDFLAGLSEEAAQIFADNGVPNKEVPRGVVWVHNPETKNVVHVVRLEHVVAITGRVVIRDATEKEREYALHNAEVDELHEIAHRVIEEHEDGETCP